MDDSTELPESEPELYELASRSDVDSSRREAAITKLAEFESEESTCRLEKLTDEGVSAIERQLAESHLSSGRSESSHDGSSLTEGIDEGSSSLEEKLQQNNETLRETLRSSEGSVETETETETESPDDS